MYSGTVGPTTTIKPPSPRDMKRELTAGYENAIGFAYMQPRKLPLWSLYMADWMRMDHQVWFGLCVSNAPLMTAKVKVEGPHKQVNAFVQEQWERIWRTSAPKILRTKTYGFCGYEAIYRHEGDHWEFDYLLDRHPRDVKPLIDTTTKKLVGVSVMQSGAGGLRGPAKMLHPKGVWLTYAAEFGQHFGRALLERAYPAWHDKVCAGGAYDMRRLRCMKDAWLGDRFRYPLEDVILPDGTKLSARDVARQISENRTSGAAMALPSTRDEQGQYKWDYEPPYVIAGENQAQLWIENLDDDIFDGLLLPKEVVEAATTGSGFSGRSIPMLAFLSTRDVEFASYVEDIDCQIIAPLVRLRFGKGADDYDIKPIPLAETFGEQVGQGPAGGAVGQGQQQGDGLNPGGGQFGSPKPGGAQQFSTATAEARWITIGGREADGEQHVGGFPVQIDGDGRILKGGPKALRGKHVSEVGSHFKNEREGRTRQGKGRFHDEHAKTRSWRQIASHQAERWGITPQQYEEVAKEVWQDKASRIESREQAKMDARKRLGITAGDVGRLENQGFDSGSKGTGIKGLDTVGRTLASEYPELGWGRGYGDEEDYDHGALVWDLVREGKQSPPSRTSEEFNDAVEEYLEYLMTDAANKAAVDYDVPTQFAWDEDDHPRDDDGMFTLKNDAPRKKSKEFFDKKSAQKNLIDGLDALPGQKDLFEDEKSRETKVSKLVKEFTGTQKMVQARAKKGGEVGANGEPYPAGAFIATTDMPKRVKDKLQQSAKGKVPVDGYKWEVPQPGKLAILDKIGGTILNPKNGEVNYGYLEYIKATTEEVAMYEEVAKKWIDGERWIDANDYPSMVGYKDIARLYVAGKPIPGAALAKFPQEVQEHFTKYKPSAEQFSIVDPPLSPSDKVLAQAEKAGGVIADDIRRRLAELIVKKKRLI